MNPTNGGPASSNEGELSRLSEDEQIGKGLGVRNQTDLSDPVIDLSGRTQTELSGQTKSQNKDE